MSDKAKTISADPEGIKCAAEILRGGGLVAIPTETVYGLAARADSAEAVAKIYRAKGRPDFNPLIVHVASLAMARKLAQFDARAELLAERFWPGSLTLVLNARADSPIVPAVTAGLATIALRQPSHPVAAELLQSVDIPLAAPSANRSYRLSPTHPEHVFASFGGDAPPVLDGGECPAGLESTIVALRAEGGWSLLRPGPVSAEEIAGVLGEAEKSRGATEAGTQIEAPGQLEKHYSPGKPLQMDCRERVPGSFMIGFGPVDGDVNLSRSGDLAEAAAHLYACLHQAAASPEKRISVAPIPDEGVGRAINDRLARAARN